MDWVCSDDDCVKEKDFEDLDVECATLWPGPLLDPALKLKQNVQL